MAKTTYSAAPWDNTAQNYFRYQIEKRNHDGAHVFVGGQMLSPYTTASDPSFYLLHCFIDKAWVDWQATKAAAQHYLPDAGTGTKWDEDKNMSDAGSVDGSGNSIKSTPADLLTPPAYD